MAQQTVIVILLDSSSRNHTAAVQRAAEKTESQPCVSIMAVCLTMRNSFCQIPSQLTVINLARCRVTTFFPSYAGPNTRRTAGQHPCDSTVRALVLQCAEYYLFLYLSIPLFFQPIRSATDFAQIQAYCTHRCTYCTTSNGVLSAHPASVWSIHVEMSSDFVASSFKIFYHPIKLHHSFKFASRENYLWRGHHILSCLCSQVLLYPVIINPSPVIRLDHVRDTWPRGQTTYFSQCKYEEQG